MELAADTLDQRADQLQPHRIFAPVVRQANPVVLNGKNPASIATAAIDRDCPVSTFRKSVLLGVGDGFAGDQGEGRRDTLAADLMVGEVQTRYNS